MKYQPLFHTLALLAYASSAAAIVWSGITQPYMNWDIIGYVGSVLSWQIPEPDTLYRTTGEMLKTEVPDWIYQQIWTDHPFLQDSASFMQQLPFYKVKILYTGSMWLLSQAGLSLPQASWWVSSASMLGVFVLLFKLRPTQLQSVWFISIMALCWLGPWPLASLARFSTPDALALFLVLLAIISWLKWKQAYVFMAAAILATAARGDNALLMCALAALSALPVSGRFRLPALHAVITIFLVIATYWLINKSAGAYDWERWFIYHFLEKTALPADLARNLTLQDYWQALSWNAQLALEDLRFWAMVVISASALVAHHLSPTRETVWKPLLLVLWLALIIRFLLFPAWQEYRYYYGFFLLIIWVSVHMLIPLLRSKQAASVKPPAIEEPMP